MPSLFVPEEMIYPAHSRFTTMARNIRQRRGKRVVINAPIYKDINTPSPFEEDFRKLDDDGEAASGALPDCIYMDAMGFGMGNCCLQVTFQASDISEAMTLYDQLANLCPLMLALGASSPAFRGHLANVDCRFNVISMSVDERTEEEMGKTTLRGKKTINRLRYSSIPCFLSAKNQSLNDISLEFNEKIYAVLREANVEEPLAKHLSHLFMKDSIVLYEEMMSQNNEADFDHFENLQSSNWHTLRFKPPPPNSDIGWRIEFRPMELQMTEFENAAYIVFVVLVTRIILTFDLDLTVPISKVDENMQTAQKVDAVLNEKFWFRKDIFTHEESFPGFIPLIRVFLNSVEEVDVATHCTLHQYLTLIEKRASGDLMTTAHWMRKFITSHPEYKSDSVITDSINYDLIMRMFKHQHNFWSIPELLGMPTSRSSPE
ncbi:hypothetical protein HPB47_001751 [Ixodes persulcatus]|uniref:Uncharacterized protein n=1 Tax=Ixodes persulcatus TaxID=34615 RepID=A0AC60PPK6_IXOPE|nr:hypothetical protein HPB47_001751 [Ixodes persulcatus]